MSREEVMLEFAGDAAEHGEHFLYVYIPANMGPMERGELFEDPLDKALRSKNLGSVTGGGSQLGEGDTIEYCGVDVVVKDRGRGIDLIVDIMRQCNAPEGTKVEEYLPKRIDHAVW